MRLGNARAIGSYTWRFKGLGWPPTGGTCLLAPSTPRVAKT